MRGLSLVAVSGGHSSSRCAGLSLSWPLLWRSRGSRRGGSAAVAHGPSCSAACGILPDQGPNPCPLRWQADSQPLRHQGSPTLHFCKPIFLWHKLPLAYFVEISPTQCLILLFPLVPKGEMNEWIKHLFHIDGRCFRYIICVYLKTNVLETKGEYNLISTRETSVFVVYLKRITGHHLCTRIGHRQSISE